MHKRSKFELYGDILLAIQEEVGRSGTAGLTRVYGRTNVPYDRFKEYISELKHNAIIETIVIEGHAHMKLTKRGLEYLEEYTHVNKFLIDFGLRNKYSE